MFQKEVNVHVDINVEIELELVSTYLKCLLKLYLMI